ncbi:MAG TPA: hypothetical protein VI980_12510 [Acidimicrobiia bacterium]|nr:hypothetical protein [Acidimicrobiia bacterium]
MADRKGLSASVALGTLLIPLSAFAATVLVKDTPPVESSTSVSTTVVEPVTEAVFAPQTATVADLAAACGEQGLRLVEAEAGESISDIQQAALDALREICAQQGMPLPGKPIPEPITQTVVVSNAQSAPAGSPASPGEESEVKPEEEHEEEDQHEVEDKHEAEDDD